MKLFENSAKPEVDKQKGGLHCMHKPPRQKFFEFSPPLQRRGIVDVLFIFIGKTLSDRTYKFF